MATSREKERQMQAWQRQLTSNARYALLRVIEQLQTEIKEKQEE